MRKTLFSLLCLFASFAGKASVVTTDLVPDSTKSVASSTGASWFAIDINMDGIEDYNFSWSFGRFGGELLYYGPSGNEVAVTGTKSLSNYDISAVTDSGKTISNTLTWASAASPGVLITGDGELGFDDAGSRFIAVRFKVGTAVHYGWVSINFSSTTLQVMSYGYESAAGTAIVTPLDAPGASFASSSITADNKTTVSFVDLSSNRPTSWEWTFTPATITYMGGTGPSSQNPQVRFNVDGKYTVKLKAGNAGGSDSLTSIDYMTVTTTPTADFTASMVSTDTKTPVTFTETCTNNPTDMEWTFTPATITYMAGTGPKSKKPQVKFNMAGRYTVSLQASNTAGTDTAVKSNYITVVDTPTAIHYYGVAGDAAKAYLNPAGTVLTIEYPAASGTIDIFDLLGKSELSAVISGNKTVLDISSLPKGCHILRISGPQGTNSQKLLIQ